MSEGPKEPQPEEEDLDRLMALARRQLPNCRVELVGGEPDSADSSVARQLPDGRWLVVACADAAADHVERRVDMLMDCFAHTLKSEEITAGAERAPATEESLERELEALAQRACGVDAFVIDMASPIVWCSASAGPTRGAAPDLETNPNAGGTVGRLQRARAEVSGELEEPQARPAAPRKLELVPAPIAHLPQRDESSGACQLPAGSRRAIGLFHERADLGPKHNGGRAVLTEGDLGLVARGFADIYVLIVVFEAVFEELRVERAMANALPRIEQLVVALPPLDPTPERPRKVISLRARRPD